MAGASNILAIYSVISVILDIVDPFHYENVLTTDALDAINKRLDLVYFQRKNNFNPEVTPEMVWDNLLGEEDESDRSWTRDLERFTLAAGLEILNDRFTLAAGS
ncbi:baculo_p74_N domain-containing protein [Trichonephila clavipes]|nr:baculo_p74_N domain-containing protein [Trichonephila clavipes]